MDRPRIGIPLSLDDRGRWHDGRDYLYIDRRYAQAIGRAGGLTLQLPPGRDTSEAIENIDGLLIPGGDDFAGDRELPDGARLDLAPAEQLASDRALYAAAANDGLPVLGICYGMQLIALAQGGRLEPHLPSSDLSVDEHRLTEDGRHAITLEADSLLASILGTGAKSVNSLHHQAIRVTGPAHRAVAHAPDGLIEAIERRRERDLGTWEIGVQWHPEKLEDETSDRLFEAFVEACRERRAKRTRSGGAG